MSLESFAPASPFDAIRHVADDGAEYWSARDLMPLLGYDKWERFAEAVTRAAEAAKNSGTINPTDHFPGAGKMVQIGSGATRIVPDFHLTRFAAYLVAMNGDPRKAEVAAAQSYFAIKTREAELGAPDITTSKGRRALALAVLQAEEALDAANERIAELEPVAAIATNLLDATGDWAVSHAAKILSRDPSVEIGRNRLFTVMSELGWIFRSGALGRRSWEAKQTAIKAALVSELPQTHKHPHTGVDVLDPPQIRVTAKGLRRLHEHLGGTAPLRLDA